MSSSELSISVIIPMWNAERTIADAIESVLEQTVAPREVLVVDNDSNDESIRVARAVSPLVRIAHEPKRGPAAARNRGVRLTTGALIAFLDADDRMTSDRLAIQSAALQEKPETAIVFGRQLVFADGDQPWREPTASWRSNSIRVGMTAGGMLCRRSAFERVGAFDDALLSGELLEWFARAQDAGLATEVLPEVVLFRRRHANNLTRDRAATSASAALALKEILDRRRRHATHAK